MSIDKKALQVALGFAFGCIMVIGIFLIVDSIVQIQCDDKTQVNLEIRIRPHPDYLTEGYEQTITGSYTIVDRDAFHDLSSPMSTMYFSSDHTEIIPSNIWLYHRYVIHVESGSFKDEAHFTPSKVYSAETLETEHFIICITIFGMK